jgi:hypothetical protein
MAYHLDRAKRLWLASGTIAKYLLVDIVEDSYLDQPQSNNPSRMMALEKAPHVE